jgi:hypothetical protein
VNLNSFAGKDKADILNNAIAEILKDEVSPTTKGTLLKQLEQPLPEVKPAEQTDEMEAVSMPGANGKRGLGRQARLLEPSGNPDVFKAVSLVLGTPEFQRQ